VEEPVDQNGEDMDVSVTHVLNTNLRGEPRHTWDW
jgi:hypothetical protein